MEKRTREDGKHLGLGWGRVEREESRLTRLWPKYLGGWMVAPVQAGLREEGDTDHETDGSPEGGRDPAQR